VSGQFPTTRRRDFTCIAILDLSGADSTSQSPKGTPGKLKTAHIVGMSIGAFFGLLAIGGLFLCFFVRSGRRRTNHQRIYSNPDEKHDDGFAAKASLNNNRGDVPGAAVHGRDRGDSLGDALPSRRILDRSYYDTRRSLSDGGANSTTPLLQPSLSQSDNLGSEREPSSFGLGLSDIHESPTTQSRSAGSLDEEFHGPSFRHSRILPLPPIFRPPRPLPMPENPRTLHPQRRSNSIQVRMQTKAPLIPSSTNSLPLFNSPPNLSSSLSSSSGSGSSPPPLSSSPSSSPSTGLRNTDSLVTPVLENLPPLLPQRRTEDSISSWSLSNTILGPVTPSRPTPSISFKDVHQPDASRPKELVKLKFRRKQQHGRKRSGESGSIPLTSESFRCAGEKAMNDEDRDFFADDCVLAESSPSSYSQSSSTRTTAQGTLIGA